MLPPTPGLPPSPEMAEIIRLADEAMYRAKRAKLGHIAPEPEQAPDEGKTKD